MKWEANGGRDLHLSSFKLTNRQMLWLTIAHVNTIKFSNHELSAFAATQLLGLYTNLIFRNYESFRQAFGCRELNVLELESVKKLFDTAEKLSKNFENLPSVRNSQRKTLESKRVVRVKNALKRACTPLHECYHNKSTECSGSTS